MNTTTRLMLSLFGFAIGSASGAPLSEGEFTRVINDVKILPVDSSPVPANPGDRISGRTAVSTGAQSRAELRFSDNTLTRLGANSVFRMDHSTRTVDVEKGVILLQVPKQMGGAKVRTAAVTAAVTGTTVMLEFTQDGFVKIIVVEGEVDVSLNENRSKFRTLAAGDMWISRVNDKTGLPLPVQVDLERLKKTSKLLSDKEFPPLGNQKHLKGALADQAKKKQQGELVDTSFVIEGRGRYVTMFNADREHIPFDTTPVADKPSPGGSSEPPPSEPPPSEPPPSEPPPSEPPANPPANPPVEPPANPPVEPPVEPPAPGPNKPVNIAGTTVFENQSSIDSATNLSNAYNSVVRGFAFLPGSQYVPAQDGLFGSYMYDAPQAFFALDTVLSENSTWFVLKGDEFYISGSPSVDPAADLRNLIMGATGDVNFTATPSVDTPGATPGDLWALDGEISNLVFTSLTGSINFDGFNLTGTSQSVTFDADGPTSDVNIGGYEPALISLPTGNFEAAAGRDVKVSGATVEAKNIKMSAGGDLQVGGGNSRPSKLAASDSITLQAKKGVKISNSSELRRLSQLNTPQVLIEAGDGNADIVDCAAVDVDMVDTTSRRGDVRIMDSTISARQIKARVYDSGGTLLVSDATLGRGTNASELIRLYGEGSNGVRFVGDTTLRGDTVQIAGSTVTIDPGSRVRLSNPAGTTIYTDTHHYNNGTNGNFTELNKCKPAEVNQYLFKDRPGY